MPRHYRIPRAVAERRTEPQLLELHDHVLQFNINLAALALRLGVLNQSFDIIIENARRHGITDRLQELMPGVPPVPSAPTLNPVPKGFGILEEKKSLLPGLIEKFELIFSPAPLIGDPA